MTDFARENMPACYPVKRRSTQLVPAIQAFVMPPSHLRFFKFARPIVHGLSFHLSILALQFHSSPVRPGNDVDHSADDFEFLSTTKVATASQVHKLIASQADTLLAKEIFDLASRQPDFRHSYATYHTLILKLGRAHQFTLMEELLCRLRTLRCPVTPGLFSKVIRIYGDAHLPDKALKTFYSIVEFNCKPTSKHLNRVLEILVAHRGSLRPAFDVFRVAYKYGASPNTRSYNIMMRAFCLNDELSVAYKLFGLMFKREIMPDVESYRILMQALCRKSQVNKAMDLLEDMLNKGFVPDTLNYTTLLNSLCRKKKLREAYKLLCRMKVRGCNPNIAHYNTVIVGLCREGRALDAIKVLGDMRANGCLPNLVSYRTLVGGLSDQAMCCEATKYMKEMMSKGFSPHFAVAHSVIRGFCIVGKTDEACGVLSTLLEHGEVPHVDSWVEVLPRICDDETGKLSALLDEVPKIEITPHTRIIEASKGLEEYLVKKFRSRS